MKLKIGTKISGGYFIMLALVFALGLFSFITIEIMSDDLDNINTFNERLAIETQIETEFLHAVNGLRGYIAYGTDNHRQNFDNGMNRLVAQANQLKEIIEDDRRPQVERLIEVAQLYHKGISEELFPAAERQFTAQTVEELELARAEVANIAGKYFPITNQLNEINSSLVQEDIANRQSYMTDTRGLMASIKNNSIIITVIASLIGGLLSIFITRMVKSPVLEMVAGTNRFAQGDFTEKITVNSQDEIGDLAAQMNNMSQQLSSLIGEVSGNAQVLAAQSEELAAASEEVNSTIEEVASTSSQVAATAEKSYENAFRAVKESEGVEIIAREGNETVKQTVDKINSIANATQQVEKAVKDLGQLSNEIGNITNVISSIAEQTNLLALNAAIEAARAGDAGRGFAVVAEEVRKLAEQSAGATKEINQLIQQVQLGVDAAAVAMENGSAQVHRIPGPYR